MSVHATLPVAPSKAAPPSQSYAGRAMKTAHDAARTVFQFSTHPLTAYFAVSSLVLSYSSSIPLSSAISSNFLAHVVAIPATRIYASYLRKSDPPPQESAKPSCVIPVTKANFKQEVLESKLPVILDAYADWCGPCKHMAPLFSSLSAEMKGKVKFVKLNVDGDRDLTEKLDVKSMPTFLFFKNGQVVGRSEGALSKDALLASIAKHLM